MRSVEEQLLIELKITNRLLLDMGGTLQGLAGFKDFSEFLAGTYEDGLRKWIKCIRAGDKIDE
jgi:hypothetical protein